MKQTCPTFGCYSFHGSNYYRLQLFRRNYSFNSFYPPGRLWQSGWYVRCNQNCQIPITHCWQLLWSDKFVTPIAHLQMSLVSLSIYNLSLIKSYSHVAANSIRKFSCIVIFNKNDYRELRTPETPCIFMINTDILYKYHDLIILKI